MGRQFTSNLIKRAIYKKAIQAMLIYKHFNQTELEIRRLNKLPNLIRLSLENNDFPISPFTEN